MSDQQWISIPEAAKAFGYSEPTLRRWCRTGQLAESDWRKTGGAYEIRRAALAGRSGHDVGIKIDLSATGLTDEAVPLLECATLLARRTRPQPGSLIAFLVEGLSLVKALRDQTSDGDEAADAFTTSYLPSAATMLDEADSARDLDFIADQLVEARAKGAKAFKRFTASIVQGFQTESMRRLGAPSREQE